MCIYQYIISRGRCSIVVFIALSALVSVTRLYFRRLVSSAREQSTQNAATAQDNAAVGGELWLLCAFAFLYFLLALVVLLDKDKVCLLHLIPICTLCITILILFWSYTNPFL